MKRVYIFALCWLLAGCASAGNHRTPEDCPLIVVENANWNEVSIYDNKGQRIVIAPGHGVTFRRSCALIGRPERFVVKGIARSMSLSLQGVRSYLVPSDTVYIYIGPSPNLSRIGR